MSDDLLSPPASKPLWLITLADLALLLVGFLVLIQASTDPVALARGIRGGFGANSTTGESAVTTPIPVDATAVAFAPGSATIANPAPLVTWARAALRDPRVTVTVTGAAGPSEVLLASDRARAVAAALTDAGLPADRLTLATAPGPNRATLTLAFAGDRKEP